MLCCDYNETLLNEYTVQTGRHAETEKKMKDISITFPFLLQFNEASNEHTKGDFAFINFSLLMKI